MVISAGNGSKSRSRRPRYNTISKADTHKTRNTPCRRMTHPRKLRKPCQPAASVLTSGFHRVSALSPQIACHGERKCPNDDAAKQRPSKYQGPWLRASQVIRQFFRNCHMVRHDQHTWRQRGLVVFKNRKLGRWTSYNIKLLLVTSVLSSKDDHGLI